MVYWEDGKMSAITEEKLELMMSYLSDMININANMWKIVYMLFEVAMLIVIFIILPVWTVKLVRWAINEIFSKK